MKIGQIILSVLIASAIASGIFIAVNINRLMQYCYKIVKFKFEGIDGKFVYLKFLFAVKNKSDLDIGILGYFIEVFLNDKSVAILSSDKPKTLSARKTSYLELPVNIEYNKVFGAIKSKDFIEDFMDKKYEKIIISLRGKFNGKFMKIKVSMPIELKMTLQEIIKEMESPSEPC